MDFYMEQVLPIVFSGMGSVQSVMSLKLWQISFLISMLNDETVKKLRENLNMK